MTVFWLILAVFFFIVEAVSIGLVTLWFFIGALFACLCAMLGAPLWGQITCFAAVSGVLLLCLRPFALKYLNTHKERTNAEAWIGKRVMVTKEVSGENVDAGEAVFNCLIWRARAQADWITIRKGETAVISAIEGSTLILIPDDRTETSNEKEDLSWSFCS